MKLEAILFAAAVLIAEAAAACGQADAPQSRAERIRTGEFHSRVLDADKRFTVVLPKNYSRRRADWPVLYLLHGRGRTERSLVEDPRACHALLAAPFVTVLPDGDDGWYIDSPVRSADRYASYLEEVIAASEAEYGLSRRREDRALSGWSMGGYGCVRFAETHPDRFAAVAPIIGLLDFPRRGLPEGQSYDVPVNRFGDRPEVWREFNPINRVEALRDMTVLLITADRAFDRTMNENFRNRLLAEGISHRWVVLPGGHTFEVVREAIPMVVDFTAQSIAGDALRR